MKYLMDTKEFEEFLLDRENLIKVFPSNDNGIIVTLCKIPLSNGCVQIYKNVFYDEIFTEQRSTSGLVGCLLPTGEIIRSCYYFDTICDESEIQHFKVMQEHEVKEMISKELCEHYQTLIDEYCNKYGKMIGNFAPESVLTNYKRTNIVSCVFEHGVDSAKTECSKIGLGLFNVEIDNNIVSFFSNKQEYCEKCFAVTTIDNSILHDSAVERKAILDYIDKLVMDKDFESRKELYEICSNTTAKLLTAIVSFPDRTMVSVKLEPRTLKNACVDTANDLQFSLNNKDYNLWRKSLTSDTINSSLTFDDVISVGYKGKTLWKKDGESE